MLSLSRVCRRGGRVEGGEVRRGRREESRVNSSYVYF